MSNGPRIVTLGDLPDENVGHITLRYDDEDDRREYLAQQQLQLGFIGIDGKLKSENFNGDEMPKALCCAACCPCCIGGPCSPNRKKEWINLLKVPTFWLIIIQIIMFIIELSLRGFESPSKNPSLGPPVKSLIETGGKYAYDMQKNVFNVYLFILL